jgi:hypothetical protein
LFNSNTNNHSSNHSQGFKPLAMDVYFIIENLQYMTNHQNPAHLTSNGFDMDSHYMASFRCSPKAKPRQFAEVVDVRRDD